jgi:acetyl-CoA acetyltransferase
VSFDRVEIPYGAYWSSPFAKWQGSLQHLHSLKLAAHVAKAELARRKIGPEAFDFGVLGVTYVQYQSFYGAPWPLYEIGLKHVPGPMLSQVCATGPRVLLTAAAEIQLGLAHTALGLACDRSSNGPHIYHPAPSGPGGTGKTEDVVLYNMSNDAIGGHSMLETAENGARKYGISTEEQHEMVLTRYAQYLEAVTDDHAFQKRYMTLPFSVPKPNFNGEAGVMEGDEGVFASTREGLGRLKPVLEGGAVTYGGQTHAADGNAAMVVTTPERAAELSTDPSIRVRIRGFGQARVELAHMYAAPIASTAKALDLAGLKISDLSAIKSHNPFAVNDIAFLKETGADPKIVNNYGCSLIWGHANAATGLRCIIELIEELAIRGGGVGLFQGCAAGDSSLAALVEVSDR